jgi:hypothetical protein
MFSAFTELNQCANSRDEVMGYSEHYDQICGYQIENLSSPKFRDSIEWQMRNLLRKALRGAPMSADQRNIAEKFLNLWIYYRNGPRRYIQPGMAKIAKCTMTSLRTVTRTTAVLREAGVMNAVGTPAGGKVNARYTMDVDALLMFCGYEAPMLVKGELLLVSSSKDGKMAPKSSAKLAHTKQVHIRIYNNTPIAKIQKLQSEAPEAEVSQSLFQDQGTEVPTKNYRNGSFENLVPKNPIQEIGIQTLEPNSWMGSFENLVPKDPIQEVENQIFEQNHWMGSLAAQVYV